MLYEQGQRVSDQLACQRLTAIFDVTNPVQHTVVAAQEWALSRHVALLADRPARVLIAPRRPDGADHLLLECGDLLAAQGYGEFFIASRDGIFTEFALAHPTTVITPNRLTLSRELREAAAAVIELPCGSPTLRLHPSAGRPMNQTAISFNGDRHLATETEPVTFGRDPGCTICLDPDDTGISRRAGSVRWENGIWWLMNDSHKRPLIVSDERTARNVLPRQRRHPLDVATRVIIDGGRRQHLLVVTPQGTIDAHARDGEPPGLPTASGLDVRLSDDDRQALAALFEEYMFNPSRIGSIRSYTKAAERIGPYHTSAQVRRRVEYLREKLAKAGVGEVKGKNALQHLAEYVIHTGQLTFDDVRHLLPPL